MQVRLPHDQRSLLRRQGYAGFRAGIAVQGKLLWSRPEREN